MHAPDVWCRHGRSLKAARCFTVVLKQGQGPSKGAGKGGNKGGIAAGGSQGFISRGKQNKGSGATTSKLSSMSDPCSSGLPIRTVHVRVGG